MDLWSPPPPRLDVASSHDSFNASALGAFTESPLGARGAGFGVGDEFETLTRHRVVGFSSYAVTLYLWGDVASSYDGTLQLEVYDSGGTLYETCDTFSSSSFSALPTNSVKNPARDRCSAIYGFMETGAGFTTVFYTASLPIPGSPLAAGSMGRIDVVRKSDSAVLRSFDLTTHDACHDYLTSSWTEHNFIHPAMPSYCFNGPYAELLFGPPFEEMVFRWQRHQLSLGNWRLRPIFAIDNFSLGVTNNDWFYNGTTLKETITMGGQFDLGTSAALPLCGGGTWSGGTSSVYDVGASATITTTPDTIDKLETGSGFWGGFSIPFDLSSDLF